MKRLLWIVAGIWGALFVALIAGPVAAMALATLGTLIWLLSSRGKSAVEAANTLKAAACEAVGAPANSKLAHAERSTAIALNSQTRRVPVSSGTSQCLMRMTERAVQKSCVKKSTRARAKSGLSDPTAKIRPSAERSPSRASDRRNATLGVRTAPLKAVRSGVHAFLSDTPDALVCDAMRRALSAAP